MPDLVVDGLSISIGDVGVVDGVSFRVSSGRSVALVGESGSGKTLTALSLLRLLPDVARVTAGSVRFGEQDLTALDASSLQRVRGAQIAMVFQEPATALNPLMRVDDQAGEALRVHQQKTKKEARAAAAALLAKLGVTRPRAYPHELSGGQRQRVMLACALSAGPQLLIADEPTTALDVTVQAQILALLQQEQQERGLSLLLITHDLGVVAQTCDDVVVMYAGKVVEAGDVASVFSAPRHPYTRALLASIPARAPVGQPLPQIPGQVPPLGQWPSGCRFRDRCALADEQCTQEPPVLDGVRCVRPQS